MSVIACYQELTWNVQEIGRLSLMIGRYFLMAVLCAPTVAQVGEFHGSPNDAKSLAVVISIANKLFPCPDAKWSPVEQTFWRHHTVLKLASCKWPHRPTIAV